MLKRRTPLVIWTDSDRLFIMMAKSCTTTEKMFMINVKATREPLGPLLADSPKVTKCEPLEELLDSGILSPKVEN